MDIYEQLIKKDYNKFIDDIEHASDNYAIIINNSDKKTYYADELLNLERVQELLDIYYFYIQKTIRIY